MLGLMGFEFQLRVQGLAFGLFCIFLFCFFFFFGGGGGLRVEGFWSLGLRVSGFRASGV